MADKSKVNLTQNLKDLEDIVSWFDEQQDVDVEAGLTQVKKAAKLIKDSKSRLSTIENEFRQIEKEIADVDQTAPSSRTSVVESTEVIITDDKSIAIDDIPF